jgi:hypothetical protein
MNVPLLRFTHKNCRSDSLKKAESYKLLSLIASVFSNRVQFETLRMTNYLGTCF